MVSILFIYIHSDFFSNRDQTLLYTNWFTELANISLLVISTMILSLFHATASQSGVIRTPTGRYDR